MHSSRELLGTHIKVHTDLGTFTRAVNKTIDKTNNILVGLGQSSSIESIEINWASGIKQVISSDDLPDFNQVFEVIEPDESTVIVDPLEKPSGFFASVNLENNVELTWLVSQSPLVDHYNLYRDGIKIAEIYDGKFLDTGLSENTNYIYRLTAVDHLSQESIAATVSAHTAIMPGMPDDLFQGLAYNPSSGQFTLRFSAEKTSKYEISSEDINLLVLIEGSSPYRQFASGSSYIFSVGFGLDPGSTLRGELYFEDSEGRRSPPVPIDFTAPDSISDSSLPSAVSNLRHEIEDDGKVKIAWDNAVDDTGIAYYEITRRALSIPGSTLIKTQVQALSYQDLNVYAGHRYEYKITAYDTYGKSSSPVYYSVDMPSSTSPNLTGFIATLRDILESRLGATSTDENYDENFDFREDGIIDEEDIETLSNFKHMDAREFRSLLIKVKNSYMTRQFTNSSSPNYVLELDLSGDGFIFMNDLQLAIKDLIYQKTN